MDEVVLIRKSTNTKGFSLLEVLVVLAIISILTAVAAPSYRKYVLKSRISTTMNILDLVKTNVIEHHMATGTMPTNNELATNLGWKLTGADITVDSNDIKTISISKSDDNRLKLTMVLNFDVKEKGRNSLTFVVKEDNKLFSTKCGVWEAEADFASAKVPSINDLSYLPTGCSDDDITNFYGP